MQRHQIKALDESTRKFGGYLIPFGSPDDLDLDGEYFAPATKGVREVFDILGGLPLMFHHEKGRPYFESQGLELPDDLPLEGPVGKITSWKTDEYGHYVEGMMGVVDASRKWYEDMLWQLVQDGKLFFSSGAIPQRVKPPRKDGFIPVWPTFEATVTPTPANPKYTDVNPIKSVKSAIDQIGLDSSKLDSLLDEGDGELPADGKSGKSDKAESVSEMSERVIRAFDAQEAVRCQMMPSVSAGYVVDVLADKSCIVRKGPDHFKVAYSDADNQFTFASPEHWIPVKREWVPLQKMDMDMEMDMHEEDDMPMNEAQKRALALLELVDLSRLI